MLVENIGIDRGIPDCQTYLPLDNDDIVHREIPDC